MNKAVTQREEFWALFALATVTTVTVAWWALALWPTGPSAPRWLVVTQSVCFGVKSNGLPDAAGWTGLIASPLGMFALLFVSGRGAFARALRAPRSWAMRAYLATLAIVILTGSAAGAVRIHSARTPQPKVALRAQPMPLLHQPAPSLRLINQFGDTTDILEFRGRTVLVTFAFAHCETVCPVIVHNALQILASRRAAQHPTTLLVVTLDPQRDTPARLPTIAQQWQIGRDAFVLSGSVPDVQRILDDWQVARNTDARTGDVVHTSMLYEVNPDGIIEAVRK